VSPWKVILATMVIFACGVVTGALVTKTVTTRGEERPMSAGPPLVRMPAGAVSQMQRVLDKQLDLNEEQRDEVGKIMKASQQRTKPLWDKIAPQMTAEIKEVREEIHAVLTPEQWKKFGELMKRNRKPNAVPPSDGRPPRSIESTTSATNATNAL
jgi:Spy/CpxP family protein refolding chaperone